MVKDLARGTGEDEEEPQGAILSLLGWLEKAALEPQAAHQKLLLDLALLLSCLVSRRSELLRWDPCGSSCLGRVGMLAQGFEASIRGTRRLSKAFTMGSIDRDCFRQCFYREYQQLVATEEERGRELAWKGLAGAAAGAALGGLGGFYLGKLRGTRWSWRCRCAKSSAGSRPRRPRAPLLVFRGRVSAYHIYSSIE